MTERPDTVGRENPRVVIVGGGFGGLEAAKALAKADAEVVLFDRHNHHLFQPLLYQIATAALSPANIAAPIRKILAKQKNCEVIMSEVTEVDLENRTVTVTDQRYAYDYLVLAAGARTNYFGNDVWSEVAPGLKNISEAIDVRSRFLLAFEQAEIETDEEARRAALTFAIVGAGPTGVELAGAMAEISRQTLRADFRHIDTSTVRVILIDAVDRVLSTFTPELSDRAQRDLEQLGVEVVLSTRVVDVRPGLLVVDTPEGEERIEAANVFWAAGVRGVRLGGTLGVELDRGSGSPGRSDHPGARARRRSGRDPNGPLRGGDDRGRGAGVCSRKTNPGSESVRLPGQGIDGHDRAEPRDRGHPWATLRRLPRLPGVGLHPRALPDRVSPPADGDA
jgi:NADH dehydrogenase